MDETYFFGTRNSRKVSKVYEIFVSIKSHAWFKKQ